MSAENVFVIVTVHVLEKHLAELRLLTPSASDEELISDAIINGLVAKRFIASGGELDDAEQA